MLVPGMLEATEPATLSPPLLPTSMPVSPPLGPTAHSAYGGMSTPGTPGPRATTTVQATDDAGWLPTAA